MLRTLETIDNAPPPRPSSPTAQLFGYMIPFHGTPFSSAPERRALVTSFNTASLEMQNQLKRLILEAEVNIQVLDRLEERLHTIHEMVQREHNAVQDQTDQVVCLSPSSGGMNNFILILSTRHSSQNYGPYLGGIVRSLPSFRLIGHCSQTSRFIDPAHSGGCLRHLSNFNNYLPTWKSCATEWRLRRSSETTRLSHSRYMSRVSARGSRE